MLVCQTGSGAERGGGGGGTGFVCGGGGGGSFLETILDGGGRADAIRLMPSRTAPAATVKVLLFILISSLGLLKVTLP